MVTKAEVEKVAALAKLEFVPEEIEALTEELNSVLGYIDLLKEADVSKVAALETMHESFENMELAPLRADHIRPSLSLHEALRNAPKAADHYFLVPKVLASQPKSTVLNRERLEEEEQDD